MRTRRRFLGGFIKWGGAVLCVVLLTLWIGSRWYLLNAQWRQTIAFMAMGGQLVMWNDGKRMLLPESGMRIGRYTPARWRWWFDYQRTGGNTFTGTPRFAIGIPIWFLALLAAAPSAVLFHRDRRRRLTGEHNNCPHCNYNLTGLPPAHSCPECGKQSS